MRSRSCGRGAPPTSSQSREDSNLCGTDTGCRSHAGPHQRMGSSQRMGAASTALVLPKGTRAWTRGWRETRPGPAKQRGQQPACRQGNCLGQRVFPLGSCYFLLLVRLRRVKLCAEISPSATSPDPSVEADKRRTSEGT